MYMYVHKHDHVSIHLEEETFADVHSMVRCVIWSRVYYMLHVLALTQPICYVYIVRICMNPLQFIIQDQTNCHKETTLMALHLQLPCAT